MSKQRKDHTVIKLNSAFNISAACARCKSIPAERLDTEWEVEIRPARSEKTWPQLKTIHMWFRECEQTDVNEFAGHDAEWWKLRFKTMFYLPMLEQAAIEDGDEEFVALIAKFRELYAAVPAAQKLFVLQTIGNQSAFSLEFITKDHAIELMEKIQRWCSERGILLTDPN